MKFPLKSLLAVSLLSLANLSPAGEAEVRKALEAKIGKIEKLAKSPMPGVWEAQIDGQIFYADDAGQYVLAGNLIELKSGKNLTAERQFNSLPLELAIKNVRGNGKGVIVTFEDPNCGYCKKLAQELQKVKNATIYTFLYPVLGDDSFEKSKAIWCASDRARAWNDLMLAGKAPAKASEKCDLAGLQRSTELGQRLRINGTPHLMFDNGERVPGYMPAPELEKRLNAS
jgi:thiol:disulfide interchange protein DsbC